MTGNNCFLEARLCFALTEHVPVLSVSGSIETLLGFRPDEFLQGNVSLRSRIHADDQDIADELFSGEADPSQGTVNLRLRQANGRIRCVKGKYKKFVEGNSRSFNLYLLLQDAKSIRRRLGTPPGLECFKTVLDTTGDYLYVKDRNHVFAAASQTLAAITDPAKHGSDLTGLTAYDVFPEEYADIHYRLEKRVFAGVAVVQEDQETLSKDGTRGWVNIRNYPIRDENGEIAGLFGIARDITNKKREEDALAESERRFRSIIEQAPMIPIQGYDKDRRIIFWNPASELHYGLTREQALGHRLEELIIPEPMRESLVNRISAWTAGGPPIPPSELTVQDASGRLFEVFSSHVMVHDKNGEPEMYCIDIDISERKRVTTKLQREHQFSESLLNNLPGIFYLYAYPENRLLLWNKRHETLLGYDAKEMAGRHVTEWHLPDAREAVLEAIEEVMQTGQISIEAPLVAKDGHLVHFALTGIRLETPGQRYFMGIGTDITERRKIQEALRLSEERHRFLADHANDVIWTMNLDGQITYVSPSIEKLRGYTPAEVMRQSLEELLTVDSLAIAKDRLGKIEAAVNANVDLPELREELEQPCKDGSTVWTEIVVSVMRNTADEFLGILGISRDISARKRMEKLSHQQVFHDPLTNLPNRRLFSDRLLHAMAASKRKGWFGALMFLDLDNFKPLNDTHGHGVGDLLLVQVAERLRDCLREIDTVARFGGDEFVVMVDDLGTDKHEATVQAGRVAEKIRASLSTPYVLTVVHEGGEGCIIEHHCTASIGVTLFLGNGADQGDILKRADKAMYHAKEVGRNAVWMDSEIPQHAGVEKNVSASFLQLAWHSGYECGNARIDDQHRALFNDANTLLATMLDRRDRENIAMLIDVLIRNVVQHFTDEEAILKEAGFPGVAEHAAIHRRLVEETVAVVSHFHAGTLGIGELLQLLFNEVIAQHMLKADREYFPYLDRPSRAPCA